MPPSRRTHANIRMHLIFPETRVIGPHFCLWSMGLFSFKFVQWAPKDASFLQLCAFWPFKVIQGRWFWYQSKARMPLPISPSLWLHVWSFLAPFLRYGDLLATNCLFFLPLSHSAPSLPMFPLAFLAEVNHEETGLMRLSCREDRMIVAGVILAWLIPACDGRAHKQRDGLTESIIANTALCIASYADALQKLTKNETKNKNRLLLSQKSVKSVWREHGGKSLIWTSKFWASNEKEWTKEVVAIETGKDDNNEMRSGKPGRIGDWYDWVNERSTDDDYKDTVEAWVKHIL